MMTEGLTTCPKCSYNRALTHYSSDGMINWIACPKCRAFRDNDGKFKDEKDEGFWKHVEKDTDFKDWKEE